MLGQVVYVALFSVWWASFLKAYPIMIKNLPNGGLINTAVKIYGGVKATKRDLILNKVDYFYHVNSIIPIILATTFYRWYLALEWLEWVPISRTLAPAVIIALAFVSYIGISHRLIESR